MSFHDEQISDVVAATQLNFRLNHANFGIYDTKAFLIWEVSLDLI